MEYKRKQVKKYAGKINFLEHRCGYCNAKCADYTTRIIHERFCQSDRR